MSAHITIVEGVVYCGTKRIGVVRRLETYARPKEPSKLCAAVVQIDFEAASDTDVVAMHPVAEGLEGVQ